MKTTPQRSPSRSSQTIRIGVTGGIGSGKSTVCTMFERRGVPVLYADDIAKNIATGDPAARRHILKHFGDKAYLPDGSLNRSYIASAVFSDKKLQDTLNTIIHPRVRRMLLKEFQRFETTKTPLVIVEAALIYEAGLDTDMDAVIVVDAKEQTRIQRVMERDGSSQADVAKRIKAQWNPARKIARADYVIQNNGSLNELETNVAFLHTLFLTLAGQPASR